MTPINKLAARPWAPKRQQQPARGLPYFLVTVYQNTSPSWRHLATNSVRWSHNRLRASSCQNRELATLLLLQIPPLTAIYPFTPWLMRIIRTLISTRSQGI